MLLVSLQRWCRLKSKCKGFHAKFAEWAKFREVLSCLSDHHFAGEAFGGDVHFFFRVVVDAYCAVLV